MVEKEFIQKLSYCENETLIGRVSTNSS